MCSVHNDISHYARLQLIFITLVWGKEEQRSMFGMLSTFPVLTLDNINIRQKIIVDFLVCETILSIDS